MTAGCPKELTILLQNLELVVIHHMFTAWFTMFQHLISVHMCTVRSQNCLITWAELLIKLILLRYVVFLIEWSWKIWFFLNNFKNNTFRSSVCIEDEYESGYCGQFGTNIKPLSAVVVEIWPFLCFFGAKKWSYLKMAQGHGFFSSDFKNFGGSGLHRPQCLRNQQWSRTPRHFLKKCPP